MIGEMVSHYRIEKKLGGGAMGVVYLAEDTRLRRPVALKFLPTELTRDELANTRFLREARLASSLDHPNICVVHEIDRTAEGNLFLVMACYEGRTLKSFLQEGPLAALVALDYANQAAAGLARADELGLVHRDIKPANLMITSHGELKIIDFGLARLQSSEKVTRTGTFLGTVTYMSPEQVQGQDATHASDIWALGSVLHEMLTGEPPFRGPIEAALLYSIVNEEPRPLELVDTRAQAVCGPILARCLAKAPEQRYQSAAELEQVLAAASRTLAPRPRGRDRVLVPQLHRRRQRRFGLAAVILLLILAVASPPVRETVRGWVDPGSKQPVGVTVLPFAVPEGDDELRAYGDGLTWLLAERLQEWGSREASFWVSPLGRLAYKSVRSPDEAVRFLGVRRTLRGVFTTEGPRWQLTLQAYDEETGRTETREFQDDLANLETWQVQVPAAAASLLKVRLPQRAAEAAHRDFTAVPGAFLAWLRGLGHLYPLSGERDPAAALGDFNSAVAQDSSFVRARIQVAAALWIGEGRRDSLQACRALELLAAAVELDTLNERAHALRGKILASCGRDDEAARAFRRALDVNPGYPEVLRDLSDVLLRLGDVQGAEQALARYVAANPNWGWAWNAKGSFFFGEDRYEEAAESFRQASALMPEEDTFFGNLGAALLELERYDEALEMFEKSLELNPSVEAYSNLGSLYFYRHRYNDAITKYRQAIALADDQYWLWGNLAEAYFWAPGLQDSSHAYFRRAVELVEVELRGGSSAREDRSFLATYYARLGDRQKTLEQIELVAAKPELTAVEMFNLADAHEQIGERDLALDWLERACEAELSIAKVEYYPGLQHMRADPRFREIMSRYGG